MKATYHKEYCFLQFEKLLPFNKVLHATFQKHGSLAVESLQNLLHLPKCAWANQIHGSTILEVSSEGMAGKADALVTNQKGIALFIFHADCQAALFYDPERHVAAAVHCGWRGSTQKIYTQTLDFLKKRYGCRMSNIIACISPSLGPSASQFINYEKELPSSFYKYQWKPCYFDFWQISRDELIDSGVAPQNIEIAEICTFSNPSDYFSYRYDQTSLRLASLISLL